MAEKNLRFVPYGVWEDPNEGFLLRAFRSDESLGRLRTFIDKYKKSNISTDLLLSLLYQLRYSIYMQSWSKTDESDAMWRLYAPNGDGVQVSTTLETTTRLPEISSMSVRYENLNLKTEIRKTIEGNKIHYEKIFSTKSQSFSHEREVRLFTPIDMDRVMNKGPNDWLRPEGLQEALGKLVFNGSLDIEGKRRALSQLNRDWKKLISFQHIDEFVKSVKVNPFASDRYVEEVRTVCETHNVRFLGRSTLYTYEN